MTREDIIKMAREAGLFVHKEVQPEIELFATLIAKHTLANIDPRSFMSWQEGYAAGAAAEREACLQIADQCADADMHASMVANAIRARSQA